MTDQTSIILFLFFLLGVAGTGLAIDELIALFKDIQKK